MGGRTLKPLVASALLVGSAVVAVVAPIAAMAYADPSAAPRSSGQEVDSVAPVLALLPRLGDPFHHSHSDIVALQQVASQRLLTLGLSKG